MKYGRPILDRGIVYDKTPLDVAALYAMLSFDATIRSNVTVGPPLELLVYRDGSLDFTEYRRFAADDSELLELHARWETALRRAVEDLPRLHYTDRPAPMQQLLMETAARP
jgi:putative proteasome-type protease